MSKRFRLPFWVVVAAWLIFAALYVVGPRVVRVVLLQLVAVGALAVGVRFYLIGPPDARDVPRFVGLLVFVGVWSAVNIGFYLPYVLSGR